jgi:hypothetical protein
MAENEIIAEIHRHREALARQCGYDVEKLSAYYRECQARYAALGHPVVSFVHENEPADSAVVREEPPKTEGKK